jgi:predicted transcriptional regulator
MGQGQTETDTAIMLTMASAIVAAYLARNAVATESIPRIIATVFHALDGLGDAVPQATRKRAMPAVPIGKSVTQDYLVCLEDGCRLKMLKRHLRVVFNMTPEQYRAKWDLPHDYPMVASGYAARRSALAKTIGLGKRRRPGTRTSERGKRHLRLHEAG